MRTTPPTRERRAVRLLWGAAAIALLTSCGVPVERRAVRIPQARLPFALGVEPGTTVAPSPGARSTTTTLVPGRLPVDRVQLFFSYGDDIVVASRSVPSGIDLPGVIALLSMGPQPGEVPSGGRSAVEQGDIAEVTVRRGMATVTLVSKFRDLPAVEQRRAVHQITLTLTALPGIGQVTFSVDDSVLGVPRLDGTSALVVSRDDFFPLVLTKIVTTTRPVQASPTVQPIG